MEQSRSTGYHVQLELICNVFRRILCSQYMIFKFVVLFVQPSGKSFDRLLRDLPVYFHRVYLNYIIMMVKSIWRNVERILGQTIDMSACHQLIKTIRLAVKIVLFKNEINSMSIPK